MKSLQPPLKYFSSFLFAMTLAVVGRGAERAIELHVLVHAPVEQVWKAWTTTDGVKTFFGPDANIEPRVDGLFEVYMNPLAEPGQKGSDGMRILALEENKLLAFTWNAPPDYPDIRRQRTHVVVRFESMGAAETLVTLHHDGWGDGGNWDKTFKYFSAAWPNVLKNLQERFDKGPIDWTEWMSSLKKYMADQQAKAGAAGK